MKERTLIYAFTIAAVVLFGVKAAFADSALRALGEANEKFYFAVKNAPEGTSREQLKKMESEIYKDAHQKMHRETQRRAGEFVQKSNSIAGEFEKELTQLDKNPKLASAVGDDSEDSGLESSNNSLDQANPRSPSSNSANTGKVEGAAGAKSVHYEKTEKKKALVIDGIIQEK